MTCFEMKRRFITPRVFEGRKKDRRAIKGYPFTKSILIKVRNFFDVRVKRVHLAKLKSLNIQSKTNKAKK